MSKVKIANVVLFVALGAGFSAPTVESLIARHTASTVTSHHSAISAFDFGGFISRLSGDINSWFLELVGRKNSVVAALEKSMGADKELEQSEINYKAAMEATKASQEAIDTHASVSPNACQILEHTSQIEEARDSQDLFAKAYSGVAAQSSVNNAKAGNTASELLETSMRDYCSPESFQRGRCSAISPKNMPDADINATSLLSTQSGEGETMSDDEFAAAARYIEWATDPVPPEALPIAMEKTETGQRFVTEQRRRAALMSASQHSLAQILGARRIKN